MFVDEDTVNSEAAHEKVLINYTNTSLSLIYLDTGASSHLTGIEEAFENKQMLKEPIKNQNGK